MVKLNRYVIWIGYFVAILNLSWAATNEQVPRGHLQDLGLHRDPEGHIDVYDELPSPEEFWRKYVSTRTAVLLKGAAKNFPAKSLWTDQYLKDTYGHLNVRLESKREGHQYPAGDVSLARDSINHFVSSYVEQNKYIVSQLPKPMYRDVLVPPCLSCGPFNNSIVEVNYWMSSGGTRSLLHKDAPNILNCLLNGTKNWLLIRPEHEYMVPLAKEPSMDGGGYSVLKVTEVDLVQFKNFRNCPYYYANVTAGDCLYVPYGTLHHVRSYGEKNMAVSFLFSRSLSHLKKFDSKGCENPKYENLASMPVAWDFDGATTLTMGLQEPRVYRDATLSIFRGKKSMTKKAFMKRLKSTLLPGEPDRLPEAVKLAVKSFQLKNRKVVTRDFIASLPMQAFKDLIMGIEMDPVNTLQYEYRLFSRNQIQELLTEARSKDGGIDSKYFKEIYMKDLGGSARVAKEILEGFDTNKDGIIDKTERKKNSKQVLQSFDEEMPSEHVNDYADVYVYRPKKEQVPERDSMDISFDPDSQEELQADGEGITVQKGYSLFGSDKEKQKQIEERRKQREEELGGGNDEEEDSRQMQDGEEDEEGRGPEGDEEDDRQQDENGDDDRDSDRDLRDEL